MMNWAQQLRLSVRGENLSCTTWIFGRLFGTALEGSHCDYDVTLRFPDVSPPYGTSIHEALYRSIGCHVYTNEHVLAGRQIFMCGM